MSGAISTVEGHPINLGSCEEPQLSPRPAHVVLDFPSLVEKHDCMAMPTTEAETINADLLAFVRSGQA